MYWQRHVADREDVIGAEEAGKKLVKDRIVFVLLWLAHPGLITKPGRRSAYDVRKAF